MAQDIGIINEIGDMGLGFRQLNEADAKKYEAANTDKQKENQTIINEEKK